MRHQLMFIVFWAGVTLLACVPATLLDFGPQYNLPGPDGGVIIEGDCPWIPYDAGDPSPCLYQIPDSGTDAGAP